MKPSPAQKLEDKALAPLRDRWKGQTVAVLASGPSLTPADAEAVRHLPTIVTNTTFRLAPWAALLFGFDAKWWKLYADEVRATFAGERVTCSRGARPMVDHCLADVVWLASFRNSGAVAVALALIGGAERVVMLGFDCQRTDGKTHWHGDHAAGLTNAISIAQWPRSFQAVSRYAAGRQVLNCSRVSALTCFPRTTLEEALA